MVGVAPCARPRCARAYRFIVSRGYVAFLSVTVVVILAARLAFAMRRIALRVTVNEAVLLSAGLAGLAFHCGAMFFRRTVEHLPGVHPAIRTINAMGAASRLWYIVPAVLVMIGLRRQYPPAIPAVAAALTAVGVTMYDHGPLITHLTAIFLAVAILAGIAATLILPPWQRDPSAKPS